MSDYTPTTEEVRESYVLMQKCGAYPNPDAEFDRWLAEVKREERKRIFVGVMVNVNKVVAAVRRGDNPIDMTWLYEELMKED